MTSLTETGTQFEPVEESGDQAGDSKQPGRDRRSPSVRRFMLILNFFLEHPQQAFTLTQIAKSLRISRATTHTILLSFVDGGYLVRRPDKSYFLGPALKTVARDVPQFSPLAIADQEMRALADELDLVVSALFREGDQLIVKQRAASLNHIGTANQTPRSAFPLYPAGNVFNLPLRRAEYEAVLDSLVPPPAERERKVLRADLELARKRGFSIGVENPDAEDAYLQEQGYVLLDVDPKAHYDILYFTAPVFDDRDCVAFILSLFGFFPRTSGARVLEIGRRLQEASRSIGALYGGSRNRA